MLPTPIHRALTFEQQLRELVERVIDAVGATGGQVRTASGEDLVAIGETGPRTLPTVPVMFADRALGTLTVHLGDPDEEDVAFLRIAAERLSVLWYEHELVHARGTQAMELDYLTEATELLAGTSSTRAALTLLTQIAVPRLGDWSAAYTVPRSPRCPTPHHGEPPPRGAARRARRSPRPRSRARREQCTRRSGPAMRCDYRSP